MDIPCSRYETVGRWRASRLIVQARRLKWDSYPNTTSFPSSPSSPSFFWIRISKGSRSDERGRKRTKMEYLNRPFSLSRSSFFPCVPFRRGRVSSPRSTFHSEFSVRRWRLSIGIRIFTSRGKSRRHLIFHARGGGRAARRGVLESVTPYRGNRPHLGSTKRSANGIASNGGSEESEKGSAEVIVGVRWQARDA